MCSSEEELCEGCGVRMQTVIWHCLSVLKVSAGAGQVRMTIADASLDGPAGVYARGKHSWTQEPSGENGWEIWT